MPRTARFDNGVLTLTLVKKQVEDRAHASGSVNGGHAQPIETSASGQRG